MSDSEYRPLLTNNTKFWALLIVLILSTMCSLFTLYHLFFDHTLRKIRNNHIVAIVLLVGLICQVTNYPWMIYYYRVEGNWQRSSIFCGIWSYIDWTFYVLQTMLFAWATIERHILIFHDHWMRTKTRQIFIHYLPPLIVIVYCIVFYILVDTLAPCENWYNTGWMRCMFFCISLDYNFWVFETLVHQLIPCSFIVIFSIALIVRVIWTKIRAHQPIQWRKQRKMTVQLLGISFNYLIFYFPYTCYFFISLWGNTSNLSSDLVSFLDFFSYFMMLGLPFACMLSLPDLAKRLERMLRCGRQRQTVIPITHTHLHETKNNTQKPTIAVKDKVG